MDDLILFGGGSSSSDNKGTTRAKYFEGLFENDSGPEKIAGGIAIASFILLFVFWPLGAAGFLISGLVAFLPHKKTFRPGYSGRCPSCNDRVRMETNETRKECDSCRKIVVRKDGEYRIAR